MEVRIEGDDDQVVLGRVFQDVTIRGGRHSEGANMHRDHAEVGKRLAVERETP